MDTLAEARVESDGVAVFEGDAVVDGEPITGDAEAVPETDPSPLALTSPLP